jgi:hypothetical protein
MRQPGRNKDFFIILELEWLDDHSEDNFESERWGLAIFGTKELAEQQVRILERTN